VRKHGGRQDGGWSFDLVDLHAKSGSLSPLKHFCYDVRQIVGRQTLPGYELVLSRDPNGTERLNFTPTPVDSLTARLRRRGLIPRPNGHPFASNVSFHSLIQEKRCRRRSAG